MAVSVTRPGVDADDARKFRFRVRDIALSGSYSTGGESITARSVGLTKILMAVSNDAAETDRTGGWNTRFEVQANGASVNMVLFESAGAGLVHTQKPAEAYESAGSVRVLFIGY